MKISVCEPFLDGNEVEYAKKAVEDNWISSLSPSVKEFEQKFADWLYNRESSTVDEFEGGRGYATTTTNGTTALILALHTLKIGGNFGGHYTDEVIIPDFTMIAVPNSVHWAGAKPVLCDVDYDTFRLDYDRVESLITPNTKAIICTHTYGIPDDMDKLVSLCKKYGLKLIEDCAEGLGCTWDGKNIGTFGDMSTFSFYANKIITTGEGGMVTSKDKGLIERAFYLKNHTFSPERHFWHKEIGHNMRMTGLQASIGLAQLEKIDEYIMKRKVNAVAYHEALKGLPLKLMPNVSGAVYWMYGVRVSHGKEEIRSYLKEKGVETRSYFIPLHKQKPYLDREYHYYPTSMRLYEEGFYLPSGTGLTTQQVTYVTTNLKKALEKVNKLG